MKIKIFMDEAWRWPLAWPVVVGCITKLQDFDESVFNDSKKLTEKKRKEIFKQINQLEKEHKLIYSFWYATNEEIDKLWIIPALNLASKRAILALFAKFINYFESNILTSKSFFDWDKFLAIQKLKEHIIKEDFKNLIPTFNKIEKLHWIIFDGNTDFNLSKDLNFKVITVIKWDQKVPLIWWASIIAKVIRDNWMQEIASKYPHYNFEKHKWYWTFLHQQAILKYWPCKIHRKTFLSKILKNNNQTMLVILHNPRCKKSRQWLEVLKQSGKEFEVREYLKNPLTLEELKELQKKLNLKPIEFARTKEKEFKENLPANPTDEEILQAMAKYPKIIERPIVYNEQKAVLGRPNPEEKIKEFLNNLD